MVDDALPVPRPANFTPAKSKGQMRARKGNGQEIVSIVHKRTRVMAGVTFTVGSLFKGTDFRLIALGTPDCPWHAIPNGNWPPEWKNQGR